MTGMRTTPPDQGSPRSEVGVLRPWRYTQKLTCGHILDYGMRANAEIADLMPYRKNGDWGSVLCPSGHCGRRRVTATCSSSNKDRIPWSGEVWVAPNA